MTREEVSEVLKQNLWRLFGTREHPAEWDGFVYGGGKLSQRFWEYFITLEFLGLDPDSVLLDVGGGGKCFFAQVVAPSVRKVIVVDPQAPSAALPGNVEYVQSSATPEALAELLPAVTHLASISVFEHVSDDEKKRLVETIDARFGGDTIALTLEFHPRVRYFQRQDTMRSLSRLLSAFRGFYVNRVESSPVAAEDTYRSIVGLGGSTQPLAIERWRPLGLQLRRLRSPG